MSIAVGSSNGVYIASEIAELVRQLSHEAERDGRDTARADAKTELALGLEQASLMHQAADDTKNGALAAGVLTIGSGLAQGVGVCELASAQTDKAAELAKQGIGLAKQTGEMSTYVNQWFQASAKHHEADGQSDAARAKARGREIDEANDNVRAARELRSSVTESNKEILRSRA